jgi:predicted regulator of amino acid metabolism with ACT domain
MRKIYYTSVKDTELINEVEECTGMKVITVYTIENSEPTEWFSVESTNDDSTIEVIDEYLIDNGYGDKSFEMILL